MHEPAIDNVGDITIHHLYWESKESSDKGEIIERRAISYQPAGHIQWQQRILKEINITGRSVFSKPFTGWVVLG